MPQSPLSCLPALTPTMHRPLRCAVARPCHRYRQGLSRICALHWEACQVQLMECLPTSMAVCSMQKWRTCMQGSPRHQHAVNMARPGSRAPARQSCSNQSVQELTDEIVAAAQGAAINAIKSSVQVRAWPANGSACRDIIPAWHNRGMREGEWCGSPGGWRCRQGAASMGWSGGCRCGCHVQAGRNRGCSKCPGMQSVIKSMHTTIPFRDVSSGTPVRPYGLILLSMPSSSRAW